MTRGLREISPRPQRQERRERTRLRRRRRRRRAYIRSVYSLPTLATLGNALCGFISIHMAALAPAHPVTTMWRAPFDPNWTTHGFMVPAYFIFIAMAFDAIDGRLARFARHTTDFGGQLDSLADVISFGVAPAFLMLEMYRVGAPPGLPMMIGRLAWAAGAMYVSCAALRLARFNVSNKHGEQHHFSFLGLPSPGAASAVAALVLVQQNLSQQATALSDPSYSSLARALSLSSDACVLLLPAVVLGAGLLMVSRIRYPHMVNRYLRGRRPMGRVIAVLVVVLALVVAPDYTIAVFSLGYVIWGALSSVYTRGWRRRPIVAGISSAEPK
jgi:CDP-diacylglycerol--serine O-phosphatidyltransferase